MHGRRHLLAVLTAIALLGAMASSVTPFSDRSAAGNDPDATGRISDTAATPAVLVARTTGGVDQLVNANLRPQRLTALTVVALLVMVGVPALAGRRRAGWRTDSTALAVSFARTTPSRAPPLLQLVAS